MEWSKTLPSTCTSRTFHLFLFCKKHHVNAVLVMHCILSYLFCLVILTFTAMPVIVESLYFSDGTQRDSTIILPGSPRVHGRHCAKANGRVKVRSRLKTTCSGFQTNLGSFVERDNLSPVFASVLPLKPGLGHLFRRLSLKNSQHVWPSGYISETELTPSFLEWDDVYPERI